MLSMNADNMTLCFRTCLFSSYLYRVPSSNRPDYFFCFKNSVPQSIQDNENRAYLF